MLGFPVVGYGTARHADKHDGLVHFLQLLHGLGLYFRQGYCRAVAVAEALNAVSAGISLLAFEQG